MAGEIMENRELSVALTNADAVPLEFSTLRSVSADTTLLSTDRVILVDTTSDDVEITLPLSSSFSANIWRNFIINHVSGTNAVIIKTTSPETFVYGNTFFNLGSSPFSFTLGTLYNGSTGTWGLVRNTTVKAKLHRTTNWASSNFSSSAIIPFTHVDYNNQDEILETEIVGGTNPGRITVKTAGTYKVSYGVDIDSTDGDTWNAIAQVFKNGVAVEGMDVRTGNYAEEDQSMSFIQTYIDLDVDDYIDLRILQNNLTGNLVASSFNIEIRL
jgi:hypothetical protein